MAQEIELKLSLPPGAVKSLLAHPLLQGGTTRRQLLRNVYFDTPELRLKAAGVALRHRHAGKLLLQTVKFGAGVAGGLANRAEWEMPVEAGHFDFSGIDDKAVRRRLESSRDQLVPIFTTNFSRLIWLLSVTPGASIELAFDRGTIESQGRRAPICEIELELKEGEPPILFDLARQLRQSLPLHPATASKDERGYALWSGQALLPVKAQAPVLSAELSPLAAFSVIADTCLRQLQKNGEGLLGSDDPEFVHQMRVALRRLRSAFKLFKPVLPADFVARWDPAWRDLGGLLGQARNWDVFVAQMLPPLAATFPAHAEIRQLKRAGEVKRAACRKSVRKAVAGAAYGALILDFTAVLFSPPFRAKQSTAPAGPDERLLREFAVRRLTRQTKRATARAKRVEQLDAAERHRMRIAFKKLRYALEAFAPLLPARHLKPYQKGLERLQDTLGELNDLRGVPMLLATVGGVKKDGVAAAWFAGRNDVQLAALPETVDRFLEIKAPWR